MSFFAFFTAFFLYLAGKDFDFSNASLPENHQSQIRPHALELRGREQPHITLSPSARPIQTSAILILFISGYPF